MNYSDRNLPVLGPQFPGQLFGLGKSHEGKKSGLVKSYFIWPDQSILDVGWKQCGFCVCFWTSSNARNDDTPELCRTSTESLCKRSHTTNFKTQKPVLVICLKNACFFSKEIDPCFVLLNKINPTRHT